jgi:hypothetical protein
MISSYLQGTNIFDAAVAAFPRGSISVGKSVWPDIQQSFWGCWMTPARAIVALLPSRLCIALNSAELGDIYSNHKQK